MHPILPFACTAALAAAIHAQAVTVTIPCGRDNTLYEDPTGQLSNGSGQYVFAGSNGAGQRRRAVLWFDVHGAVPAGASVLSATLRLNVSRASSPGSVTMQVFRLLADFGEGASVGASGEGGGAPAQPPDATWLHSQFPSTFWVQAGGDYDPVPRTTVGVPAAGTVVVGTSLPMIGDVQEWLRAPQQNHGWLLRDAETATSTSRRFDSRNNVDPLVRPVLTVVYQPAGSAQSFGFGCLGSNNLPLTLTIAGLQQQGTTSSITYSTGLPGGFVVTLLSYAIAPVPIEFEPGCALHLALIDFPHMGLRVLDGNGFHTENLAIPVAPGLFGLPVAFQGLGADPALARGFVLSNAWLVVVQ
jgi:hypothetical protein